MGKPLPTYKNKHKNGVRFLTRKTIQSRKCRMKYLEALRKKKNYQPKILYAVKQKQMKSLKRDRKINFPDGASGKNLLTMKET